MNRDGTYSFFHKPIYQILHYYISEAVSVPPFVETHRGYKITATERL